MPSKEAQFINDMFKNMPRGEDDGKGYLREREEGRKRVKPSLPAGVTLRELNLAGNYAELIEKEGNNGPLVMYIHGGGFKTGDARERREITFEIADKYKSNVIANNYRLAPENKWPAALEDCVAVYKAIMEMGYKPEDIIVAGESAGGALVIGVLLYLRDNGIALPKAAVTYSASITHSVHFKSHYDNAKTDYMLGDAVASDDDMSDLFGDEADTLCKSPYISPCFADVTGLPPFFIAASDIEALYDDSRIFYEMLTEKGIKAELYVGHELIHAYPIFPNLPESVDTMVKTFEFINKL